MPNDNQQQHSLLPSMIFMGSLDEKLGPRPPFPVRHSDTFYVLGDPRTLSMDSGTLTVFPGAYTQGP